jgi:toxin ParE1/3/4
LTQTDVGWPYTDASTQPCVRLKKFPERGHRPPELERIGVYQYRKVHFKPYRILYEISESRVIIHCVLDGRRSLQEMLERRLFR